MTDRTGRIVWGFFFFKGRRENGDGDSDNGRRNKSERQPHKTHSHTGRRKDSQHNDIRRPGARIGSDH